MGAGFEVGGSTSFLGTGVEIQGGLFFVSGGWTGSNMSGSGTGSTWAMGVGPSLTSGAFRSGGSHTFSQSYTPW